MTGFRVLFVYPNFQLSHLLLPAGVSILSAVLKERGVETRVFDTTLYRFQERTLDEVRQDILQLRRFELDSVVHLKDAPMLGDFLTELDDYRPHLVAASVLQDTLVIAEPLLLAAHDRGVPVLVGGIYPTFAPEDVIQEPYVDLLCVGEGEKLMVGLCERMARGQAYDDLPNLWVKRPDGTVRRNPIGTLVNVNELPFADYDIFEPDRFYRAMQGRVMRILPVEMHRGCPYQCAFCEDPQLNVLYRQGPNKERYHRAKSPQRLIDEVKHFVERYGAEYIYFNAETFFAMPSDDFEEMARLYAEEVHLPFWLQTRPETITDRRIALLKEMNVHHMNIGIEHGNEEFRRTVLRRSMRNSLIIDSLRRLDESGIPTTVNNILGFPDETRELVFDTIELNRNIRSATINAYLYNPYKGTELYEVCRQKGYLPTEDDEKVEDIALSSESFAYFKTILNMPQISKAELLGLQRTFVLYAKLPRSEFPRIRIAERLDDEGDAMFAELRSEYLEGAFEPVELAT